MTTSPHNGNRTSRAERPSSARTELLAWARARDFRDRAAEYLKMARGASDNGVQRRLIDIAQHYRVLSAAEARDAGRLTNKRREKKSNISGKRTFDGKAEIQTLRMRLRLFARQQTDHTIRSQCFVVDKKLAELSEENDLILRQVLASHVQQLEQTLRAREKVGLDNS